MVSRRIRKFTISFECLANSFVAGKHFNKVKEREDIV